jgi:hypothetical protein
MCEHNDFEILYYKDGIMVRRCRSCRLVEINVDYWVEFERIKEALFTVGGI